ncbi:hypothetical protein CLU79DRAFT_766959 [Phycomyces nitens]|nr:hypothetical protein CLU79DRAFT_766959 [Phycomyces nitens]
MVMYPITEKRICLYTSSLKFNIFLFEILKNIIVIIIIIIMTMMASELPFDILRCIGYHLQNKEIAQCCLVCKKWVSPFQECLFEQISIHNYTQFAEAVDISSPTNNLIKRYGHKTRKLSISPGTEIDGQQLWCLQQELPYIQQFTWSGAYLDKDLSLDTGWNMWKYLTDLEINAKNYYTDMAKDAFYSILPHLHILKRLTFQPDLYEHVVFGHSMQELELLNEQLDRLDYMLLGAQPMDISPQELSSIKDVKPMPCLKTFDAIIDICPYEWLYYIAVKYPNISTLKTVELSGTANDQSFEAAKMFELLPFPFQHLQVIHITVNQSYAQLYLNFCSQLQRVDCQIKELDITLANTMDDIAIFQDVLVSAKSFLKTLQKLTIRSSWIDKLYWLFTKRLHTCNLVELDIWVEHTKVAMDVLLDKCPSLKIFKIAAGSIFIRSATPTVSADHGLENLSLNVMSVPVNALNHISFCCKKLESLRLECVNIMGSQSESISTDCIDLSSTHITELYIDNIRFYEHSKTFNLFALSLSTNPTEFIWVYSIYQKLKEHRQSKSKTGKLDKEESKVAKEYFCGLPENTGPDSTKAEVYKDIHSMENSNWQKIIQNGYILVKCASLKNLIFKSNEE